MIMTFFYYYLYIIMTLISSFQLFISTLYYTILPFLSHKFDVFIS